MPTLIPSLWAEATACLMNAKLDASSFQHPVHCSMSNLVQHRNLRSVRNGNNICEERETQGRQPVPQLAILDIVALQVVVDCAHGVCGRVVAAAVGTQERILEDPYQKWLKPTNRRKWVGGRECTMSTWANPAAQALLTQ